MFPKGDEIDLHEAGVCNYNYNLMDCTPTCIVKELTAANSDIRIGLACVTLAAFLLLTVKVANHNQPQMRETWLIFTLQSGTALALSTLTRNLKLYDNSTEIILQCVNCTLYSIGHWILSW